MYLSWIVTPLVQYACLALTLVGCLGFFLSLKREITRVQRSCEEGRKEAIAATAAVTVGLTTLREEIDCAEAPAFTGQELNLNRRAQVLRMHRRGEASTTIAAALRVPRNEIDLLLKVQKLVPQDGAPQAPSRD